MILFCEECGTRHDIDSEQFEGNHFKFSCSECSETLVVSLSGNTGKQVQAAMKAEDAASVAPLKVLVVDDSKMLRKALRQIIESDGRKTVVGEAEHGKKALDLLMAASPDVVTMDINMPVMDGLTALKHIMIKRPTPTVMISALTTEGALETFDALKYGAIDFLPKPSQLKGEDLNVQKDQILSKIDLAAGVQIESVRYLRRASQKKNNDHETTPCRFLLAIGAADGGYGALLNVVPSLRRDLPGAYAAVLHQAPHHVDAFVRYLNQCSQIEVQRAKHDIPIKSGTCYLAAMNESVVFKKRGDDVRLQVTAAGNAGPSDVIDTMMRSASEVVQEKAAGVILSGTGNDGIRGLGRIISSGGKAFVQNPVNCLFKTTPLMAIEEYTVDYVVSDKQMAGAINSFLIAQSV